MFKSKDITLRIFWLITTLSLFACNYIQPQKDATVVTSDMAKQLELSPFPKDSVEIGIKWFWIDRFKYTKKEERFALNLQNHSDCSVTLDSVYEIGAWRNKDSTYTLLYRDTINRLLSIDKHSVACDTLHPRVKDVYRSKSDFDQYLLCIRAWCEGGDTIKLAYHITEPDWWEEKGTGMFHLDTEESHGDLYVAIHTPMQVSTGTDYNNLMNKMYVCTIERPKGTK